MFHPFTTPACKISGVKDARTRLKNSIVSGLITNLFSVLCVWMKILSQASAKKKAKSLRVSNFALLLVVFKRLRGSEGVNIQELH